MPLLLSCALEVHGRLALASGDGGRAEADLREALGIAASGGVPPSYVAATHATLARILWAAGKHDEAASHRNRALELARGAGDTWLVARLEATA